MKRFVPMLCAGLLAALLPTTANADACTYQPNQVAGFPGGNGLGRLTDTNGVNGFVGVAFHGTTTDPYPHGAVWRDGVTVADFGALGMVMGVNRAGDAVGYNVGGTAAVYRPRGGTAIRLAIPAQVTRAVPTVSGISDDGLIVGNARFDDGTDHAITWQAATAGTTYRDLGTTGVRTAVTDVSDDGRIAGTVKRGQHLSAATGTGTGTGTGLTALPGVDPAADSQANDIAGRFVLGKGTVPGRGTGTVLWENGVPRLIATTGTATDVNTSGLVVGNDANGPFVQQGARTTLSALPGHTAAQALAVTEDGRVAGWSKGAAGEVPVIWACG